MARQTDSGRPGLTIRRPTSLRQIPGPARIIGIGFILLLVTIGSSWAAPPAVVRLHVPTSASGAFEIVIHIDNVWDLDAGQFDLSYDARAIQIMEVKDGVIGDIAVPVGPWTILNPGRIRVLFNIPGARGVSGTGHLTRIQANAIGKPLETIPLTIHQGLLVNKEAAGIPAQWISGCVTIEGVVPEAGPASAPEADPAADSDVQSQGITLSTPMALAGLAVLAAVPGLFLILLRFRKRKSP